jgi:excisionase family DNA binding protein
LAIVDDRVALVRAAGRSVATVTGRFASFVLRDRSLVGLGLDRLVSVGMAEEELYTVDEVADRLKVNQQTVRNWIDRGTLTAVRVGARRVRIRSVDLNAFLGSEAFGDRAVEAEPVPVDQEPSLDLRRVVALTQAMLDEAAELPIDSPIGRELAESAGRLQSLMRRAA